jgi:hypothetical protein
MNRLKYPEVAERTGPGRIPASALEANLGEIAQRSLLLMDKCLLVPTPGLDTFLAGNLHLSKSSPEKPVIRASLYLSRLVIERSIEDVKIVNKAFGISGVYEWSEDIAVVTADIGHDIDDLRELDITATKEFTRSDHKTTGTRRITSIHSSYFRVQGQLDNIRHSLDQAENMAESMYKF